MRLSPLAAACAALTIAGCGGVPTTPAHALRDSAKLSHDAIDFSHSTMRRWCPAAVQNDGRDLTQAQARACLRRAAVEYRAVLKKDGYDPTTVTNAAP